VDPATDGDMNLGLVPEVAGKRSR